jgi:hypothetical protein
MSGFEFEQEPEDKSVAEVIDNAKANKTYIMTKQARKTQKDTNFLVTV